MVKYYFIKITDNNNVNDFHLDITKMPDCRLRIGSLKSQYKQYLKTNKNYKIVFKYFDLDYSFYVVDRGEFENYQDVKMRRDELINFYKKKLEIKI
jgi:hypothetical protein